MNGIINFDKPAGITSAAAVNHVKRLLPRGIRIGHAGTLDPFATGVLLLLVGNATKACEHLMDQGKTYETIIKFGATTATDDPESDEVPTLNPIVPSPERVSEALMGFVGVIQQRPPAFSAMKVTGRRAYELARKGEAVDLPPRAVRVDGIDILHWQWPRLKLRIRCGRGTYIRAIARDLGEKLEVGGYLTELRRARIGEFYAENSVALEQLTRDGVDAHIRTVAGGRP